MDMADICTVMTTVKSMLSTMDSTRDYCRCCFSANTTETLRGPPLDVYMLICNPQGLEHNTRTKTCLRCHNFLKEVHRFRIKCHAVDEIFRDNLDVTHLDIEMILRKAIDYDPPTVEVKAEVNDHYTEIDQIDDQINSVEIEYEPENQQKTIEPPLKCTDLHGKLVECDNCSSQCENDEQMIVRLESMETDQNSKKEVDCEPIEMNYSSDEAIVKLLDGKRRSDGRPFICRYCPFKTIWKQSMIRHRRVLHDKIVANDKSKTQYSYICDYCGYHSKMKANLVEHIQRHMNKNKKPYKCSKCSVKFAVKVDLTHHMYNHNKEKTFSCDQCDSRFKLRRQLIRHKDRVHQSPGTRERRFKCSLCEYKTYSKSDLKVHALAHTDEKPFACDHCDFHTKSKNWLKSHIKTHFKDKRYKKKVSIDLYKCEICKFKTIYKRSLKEHILVKHSDEYPVACDQCDFVCKVKKQLVQHRKIHA